MGIRLKMYQGLIENTESEISILANTTAFIMQELADVSWVGFYLQQNDELILGPFQGKVACTNITIGKGVCGTAAATMQTQLVPNVHLFPGHIACDAASNSEIVVPIQLATKLYGVLDLDSTSYERFTEIDQLFLEQLCELLVHQLQRIKEK